jgi:hypothetical protein
MVCETRLKPRQTIQERAAEVRSAVGRLDALLKKRRVKPRVGPQGAIAFDGWDNKDRDGVSDNCAYRQIMKHGSSLAKAEIAKAEMLAGRSVDKQVVAQGVHAHGDEWHGKG